MLSVLRGRGVRRATLLALTLACAAAEPARAQQSETGGRVFGIVGGVFADGDTSLAVAGGAGFRFQPRLRVDLELFYAPDVGMPIDLDVVIQTLTGSFAPVERVERSRLATFLTTMTVEFPAVDGRLQPYITGGGGVGSLRQSVTFRNLPLPTAESVRPATFPGPVIERSATDPAWTIGGGLGARVWRCLAVGVDIRYVRLLSDTGGFGVARVGSQLSARF